MKALGPHKPVVVGIGEILWDTLPAGKQLGGAPANFAYHAQALGCEAIAASCVGDDALGREIRAKLDVMKMSPRFLAIDSAYPTGTVDVSVDSKGVPTFTIRELVAWDFIPATPGLLELAARADAVCFGSLAQRCSASRQTIRHFLASTRPDCLRVFDINLRQGYFGREIVHESLAVSRVLKLNDGELPVLAKLLEIQGEERRIIDELMQRYSLRMIALTRGDAGSTLYADGRAYHHPGFRTTIVDTVGAGDAFTAALAAGLLRGDDPDQINRRANRLASYVCSQCGATPAIPAGLLG